MTVVFDDDSVFCELDPAEHGVGVVRILDELGQGDVGAADQMLPELPQQGRIDREPRDIFRLSSEGLRRDHRFSVDRGELLGALIRRLFDRHRRMSRELFRSHRSTHPARSTTDSRLPLRERPHRHFPVAQAKAEAASAIVVRSRYPRSPRWRVSLAPSLAGIRPCRLLVSCSMSLIARIMEAARSMAADRELAGERVDRARSALMSRVRCKNTKPELVVRREVHALGYRFRLHRVRSAGYARSRLSAPAQGRFRSRVFLAPARGLSPNDHADHACLLLAEKIRTERAARSTKRDDAGGARVEGPRDMGVRDIRSIQTDRVAVVVSGVAKVKRSAAWSRVAASLYQWTESPR